MRNISIFGLGYVGCVSLGCLAKNGYNIIGVDVAQNKVDLINQGKPTIVEKDIAQIIEEQWKLKKISATTDFCLAVKETEISILCVGTPSTEYGHLDLKYIFKTAEEIGLGLKEKNSFHTIVIRSTVMPGTNFKVGEIIEKYSGKKRNVDFAVVSNPEFLREGTAVEDYYNPSITVLGCDNENALNIMTEVYAKVNAPIERTEIEVAEIIKYVNNSYHALKVTFANEIGNICKNLHIDSHKVMDLFVKDKQLNISPYYFKPGFAYGGSCLPKDLKGLKTLAHDHYLTCPLIESIEKSNQIQKEIALKLIIEKEKKNIGVLGLSFKKGTDDLRYSPIVEVTERLLGKGYKILIYDKNVKLSHLTGTNKEYIDKTIPHLSELILNDIKDVIEKSEVIVLTYNSSDFKELNKLYPHKEFIDLARVFDGKSKGNVDGICW